jgi:hypothetical protein
LKLKLTGNVGAPVHQQVADLACLGAEAHGHVVYRVAGAQLLEDLWWRMPGNAEQGNTFKTYKRLSPFARGPQAQWRVLAAVTLALPALLQTNLGKVEL